MNTRIKLITALALAAVALLVTASDQAYADVIIIVGSEVGQRNNGDIKTNSGEGDGPSTLDGSSFEAGNVRIN
jgi:hypothetical protein